MKTKEKGILAEQKVITKFIEHGYTVSSVIGDNARYDLVVEAENKLQRIQVKHARIRNGCVTFNTLSYRINTKKIYLTNYVGQADYFAAWCADNDKIYIVPIGDNKNKSVCYLRVEPTKNGQLAGVVNADNYEFNETWRNW